MLFCAVCGLKDGETAQRNSNLRWKRQHVRKGIGDKELDIGYKENQHLEIFIVKERQMQYSIITVLSW